MTSLDELFGARAAVIVPGAISAAHADEVRARLAARGFTRYALVDRGSYAWTDDVDEPGLVTALVRAATDVVGGAPDDYDVVEVRALRLVAGDYLLAHHDRVHDDRRVELVLDVSAAATTGAEVHYRRHGQLFHRVPSHPGALSVVERDAAVTCHHTYVSRRNIDAEVTRLTLRLRSRTVAL
ncbi:MAG TPA: hypothetical protein VM261_04370 [Kofleriaceae bacterium]|nr:hypothetical protein [Kofleriaceae bacterium]